MFSDFASSQSILDNIKYELISIVNGGLVLYPSSFYILGLNDKVLNLYIVGIYIAVSFLISKIIDSLCPPLEQFIDRIQELRLEERSSVSSPDLAKKIANENFTDNWNDYLTLQFDKSCLPMGQKYLSNIAAYFKIQINTSISFFIISLQLIFLITSITFNCFSLFTILLGFMPVIIGTIIHVKFSMNKLFLISILLVFGLPILFGLHGSTHFNIKVLTLYDLLKIENYLLLLSMLIFNIMFLVSLRGSWALYKIRGELLEKDPKSKYIRQSDSNK